jgi:tRNA (guanine-N7-)-methyltransferase
MTTAQSRAIESLWTRYGIERDAAGSLDLDVLFGRHAPRVLEIGFGMGDALASMAAEYPHLDYLGIEVYRPGIGSLLRRLRERDLSNVRVFCADAVEVLQSRIADSSLHTVYLLFPDPWPKRRHHKRRLVQRGFVELLARKLVDSGMFHLATDCEDYAVQIIEVVGACPDFRDAGDDAKPADACGGRPLTKFESRARRIGRLVWNFRFQRCARLTESATPRIQQ